MQINYETSSQDSGASERRHPLGKLTGHKPALKTKEVSAIRTRLEIDGSARDSALFNLAIDSKLRGCDLVSLKVGDVAAGGEIKSRSAIIQKKTGRPVQFEITGNTQKNQFAVFWRHAALALRTTSFEAVSKSLLIYQRVNMHSLLRAGCDPSD